MGGFVATLLPNRIISTNIIWLTLALLCHFLEYALNFRKFNLAAALFTFTLVGTCTAVEPQSNSENFLSAPSAQLIDLIVSQHNTSSPSNREVIAAYVKMFTSLGGSVVATVGTGYAAFFTRADDLGELRSYLFGTSIGLMVISSLCFLRHFRRVLVLLELQERSNQPQVV